MWGRGPGVFLSPCRVPAGSSQQYLGQEEYYGGEQYGHSQAASEPLTQQYYPDGEARACSGLRGLGPLTAPSCPAKHPESPMPELMGDRDGQGHPTPGAPRLF